MRSSAFRQLRESPAVADPADAIFDLSPAVRYVAFAHGQDVRLRERPGLSAASSGDSDRYEELLVNPALITLARQRGDIDCGGLDYLSSERSVPLAPQTMRVSRYFVMARPGLEPGHHDFSRVTPTSGSA